MTAKAYDGPFGLENLPYGIITTKTDLNKRCAIAYKDWAIDLSTVHRDGCFSSTEELGNDIFQRVGSWNEFAVLSKRARASFREILRTCIVNERIDNALVPLNEVQYHLPMDTHNFSDFYCSLEHTKNCSELFGAEIKSNWYSMPSVYNGRTSSLIVSGTDFHRPYGLFPDANSAGNVAFQPETHMDFEREMGVWLCTPVPRGQRLDINRAKGHIFGVTLRNDWSARQIQAFEMPPLGPFHGKGSATTVSPWILPIEALETVKCARKTTQDPPPPSHLAWNDDASATFDIELRVKIFRNGETYNVCESNVNELHWTPFQQITHLTAAGEGLSPGDLFGTGTISSNRTNAESERIGLGCLLERKLPDARLESMPNDLVDTFLLDGDEVIMEGFGRNKSGQVVFGFGECRGKILPAWQRSERDVAHTPSLPLL